MTLHIKRIHILALFAIVVLLNAISFGYAYFDDTDDDNLGQIIVGNWNYNNVELTDQLAEDIAAYIDEQIALDPNSDLQSIYDQSGNLSKVTVVVENISGHGYVWNLTGIGTATPTPTLGFLQLVNRELDISDNPVHAILPPAPVEPPPYTDYDYFMAFDVNNLLTNNQYSIRLNYGITMETNAVVSNITQITFYASRGLESPDDDIAMATDRAFTVEISLDGVNWIQIGTDVPPVPTSNDINFGLYTYDIPTEYEGLDLFVRIGYAGEALKLGNDRSLSRLVIDELEFVIGD